MSFTLQHGWALCLLAVPAFMVLWAWRRGLGATRSGRLTLGLRAAVCAAIVLAAADLGILDRSNTLGVVYVVDASRSVGTAANAADGISAGARRWVEQSISSRPEGDAAGVIVFAGQPQIERLVRDADDLPLWAASTDQGNTDIESALRLGMVSRRAHSTKRVIDCPRDHVVDC